MSRISVCGNNEIPACVRWECPALTGARLLTSGDGHSLLTRDPGELGTLQLQDTRTGQHIWSAPDTGPGCCWWKYPDSLQPRRWWWDDDMILITWAQDTWHKMHRWAPSGHFGLCTEYSASSSHLTTLFSKWKFSIWWALFGLYCQALVPNPVPLDPIPNPKK